MTARSAAVPGKVTHARAVHDSLSTRSMSAARRFCALRLVPRLHNWRALYVQRSNALDRYEVRRRRRLGRAEAAPENSAVLMLISGDAAELMCTVTSPNFCDAALLPMPQIILSGCPTVPAACG
eukprot:356861-Chlamydomonas_euryale.AAC.17